MRRYWIFFALLLVCCADAVAQSTYPRILCGGVYQGKPPQIDFTGGGACSGGPSGLVVPVGGGGGGGGAPTTAQYWTGAADATLTAEKNLGALATGLVINTGGVPSAYGGSSCAANQYASSESAVGALTCSQVTAAQISGAILNSQLSDSYSGVGACGANNWVSTLNTNAPPTCTQPGFSNISGTVTDAQLANNYSGIGACAAGRFASTLNDNASPTCTQVAYGDLSGTPTIPADISAASYITKVAEASLSNEFALGSLATGLLLNTTVTGVPTIYAGTSCSAGQYMNALNASGVKTCAQVAYSQLSGTPIVPVVGGAAGDIQTNDGFGSLAAYGATSCTNKFFTGLSSAGAPTCTTATLASAQFANQGTTAQVLHGNAAGNPAWGSVDLSADTAATVLPLSKGGTNKNNTASNGAIVYSDATTFLPSAVGTAGQGLYSGGAGAPTWSDSDKVVRLTADYTNATTTLSNTALTWTSPAAVSRSAFVCQLMVKGSAVTTGGQFDVNVSVAPTTITYQLTWVSAAGTAPSTGGTSAFVAATASATLLGPAGAILTTYTIWKLEGIIVHTSSAATVTVRGKAGAAGTLTVGSGSNCQYYVL